MTDITNPQPNPHPPRQPRRFGWLIALAIVALLAVLAWRHHQQKVARTRQDEAQQAAVLPVVTVAPAVSGSARHFLNGLGTVTPMNNVVVHSRIDGQLMAVYFHEGQMVQKGMLLALLDPRSAQIQLTQANGQMQRDSATLNQAQMDLGRYVPLAKDQAIPQQQADQQKSVVDQYTGTVKFDTGQIDNARLQLAYAHITAPIAGRAGLRLIDPGNIVHAGDANGLVTITQVTPINVTFNLSEDDLPALQRALQKNRQLPVEAWDRINVAKIASGRILSLDNTIDAASGTLKVKAVFDNRAGMLFPNEFVNIRVLSGVQQNATLVPVSAIQRNTDTAYVYVVDGSQTVHVRAVQPGVTDGDTIEILSGLHVGDVVVTQGFDKLQDDIRVKQGQAVSTPTADGPTQ